MGKPRMDTIKVLKEVASFKTEYPNYTTEQVEDYIKLLDDFNSAEKQQFIINLGY